MPASSPLLGGLLLLDLLQQVLHRARQLLKFEGGNLISPAVQLRINFGGFGFYRLACLFGFLGNEGSTEAEKLAQAASSRSKERAVMTSPSKVLNSVTI